VSCRAGSAENIARFPVDPPAAAGERAAGNHDPLNGCAGPRASAAAIGANGASAFAAIPMAGDATGAIASTAACATAPSRA
jgi:hypothetical protein